MSTQEEFFDAIQEGRKADVEQMLRVDSALAESNNDEGVTALLWAKYNRRDDVAMSLIDAGAPLDLFALAATGDAGGVREFVTGDAGGVLARSPDGFSALHLACYFGHPEVASVLVECGADPESVADNGSGLRPIHSAVASGCGAAVTLLLSAGADVNARQTGGWTPLHAAAKHGDLEITRALLDVGASPGAISDDGKSAMDFAKESGASDVQELLAARGASSSDR